MEHQLRVHQHTLTVNLNKNKRPGGGLIEDGVDFELFADTGQLVALNGTCPASTAVTSGRSLENDPYEGREASW